MIGFCTGCHYITLRTDYTPAKIQVVSSPKQKLYVHNLSVNIGVSISSPRLRETLCSKYPTLFVMEWQENVCPIDVLVTSPATHGPNSWSAFWSGLCCYFTFSILPSHQTFEDADFSLMVRIPPDVTREIDQNYFLTSERVLGINYSNWALPWSDVLWMGEYDYGPYKEIDPIRGMANANILPPQEWVYEEIAAMIVAVYNQNPEAWVYHSSANANEAVSVVDEDDTAYTVIRKSFDAQSNMGKFRIRFNEATPSEGTLSAIQEDVRNFCRTAYRENNPGANSESLLILREDYRAIGKTLKLYEFTLTLGAVEFIGLQYDNATLLGTITIRLPGGNPENARKWVTENLDRLVEEYNISADEVIDGEYQLTSEKMSADGMYTVAFEVIN